MKFSIKKIKQMTKKWMTVGRPRKGAMKKPYEWEMEKVLVHMVEVAEVTTP